MQTNNYHIFNKDMFQLHTDLITNDNDVIDGYWNGKKFTSNYKQVMMIHKSNLEEEKIKANNWCKLHINDEIPYDFKIFVTSAEESIELDY